MSQTSLRMWQMAGHATNLRAANSGHMLDQGEMVPHRRPTCNREAHGARIGRARPPPPQSGSALGEPWQGLCWSPAGCPIVFAGVGFWRGFQRVPACTQRVVLRSERPDSFSYITEISIRRRFTSMKLTPEDPSQSRCPVQPRCRRPPDSRTCSGVYVRLRLHRLTARRHRGVHRAGAGDGGGSPPTNPCLARAAPL